MARGPRGERTVGGERAAYEKLTEACRHGIEAATELGVRQSNNDWATVATLFEQLLHKVNNHYVARNAARVRSMN